VARVLALSNDLMLGSKVAETLRAAGHEVTLAASLQEASLDGVELLVADLELGNPEALVGLGVPVLGYYSHVDVDTRAAAEAAGVDLAVPRSRLARELPALAERLLGAG
jgi:nucleoside-diphosphate-sugar epimerase